MTPAPHRQTLDAVSTAAEVAALRSDVDNLADKVNDLANDFRGFMALVEPMLADRSGNQERMSAISKLSESAHERIDKLRIELDAIRSRQNAFFASVGGGLFVLQVFGFLAFTDSGQTLLKRLLGIQ